MKRLDLEDETSENHGFGNMPPDTLLFLKFFSKFKNSSAQSYDMLN